MAVRSTQAFIEVWYAANNATARSTQTFLEVAPREYVVDPTANQYAVIQAPAAFPLPSNGGPQYSNFLRLAPQYFVDVQKFKTGGRDFRLKTETKIYEWVIQYDFLTEADALILDNHFISARGQWAGFDLAEPRVGSTFQNVHYAPSGLVSKTAQKRWSPKREIKLTWSSATGSIAASDSGDEWDGDTWDSELFGA